MQITTFYILISITFLALSRNVKWVFTLIDTALFTLGINIDETWFSTKFQLIARVLVPKGRLLFLLLVTRSYVLKYFFLEKSY